MLQSLKINLSKTYFIMLIMILVVSCERGGISKKPPVHVNPNMDLQEKYKAQAESKFFKDGRTMRTPVKGTVARGFLKADIHLYQGKKSSNTSQFATTFPSLEKLGYSNPDNRENYKALLKRGQERYNIYCSMCHGKLGDGKGTVSKEKGLNVPPSDLRIAVYYKKPLGELFSIISHGVIRNGTVTMPSYSLQLHEKDRWAVIAYLRTLQKAYKKYEHSESK